MAVRELRRSKQHRMIAGVCGGVADWLGWSPTAVRIVFAAVSVLSAAFPGIIVYLILWIVIPTRTEVAKVGATPPSIWPLLENNVSRGS